MWRWTAGGQRAPSGLMPNSLVRLKCPKSHPTVIIVLYSFPLKRLLNNLMPMYQLIFLMTAVSFLNDQSRCALQTRSHTQSNFIPPLCLHKRQLGPDPLLLLFNFHNKSPTKQKHYPTVSLRELKFTHCFWAEHQFTAERLTDAARGQQGPRVRSSTCTNLSNPSFWKSVTDWPQKAGSLRVICFFTWI